MANDLKTLSSQLGVPLSAGAIAGLIATLPMTLFMLLMQQLLPHHQKYALPPERITGQLAHRAGQKHMSKPQLLATTLVSHFGYGSFMGTLYGTLSKKVRLPLPAAVNGIIFGLIVWAGSYLGLLPSMEMKSSAPQEPLQRNLMMIGAHIIWGAITGVVTDFLQE